MRAMPDKIFINLVLAVVFFSAKATAQQTYSESRMVVIPAAAAVAAPASTSNSTSAPTAEETLKSATLSVSTDANTTANLGASLIQRLDRIQTRIQNLNFQDSANSASEEVLCKECQRVPLEFMSCDSGNSMGHDGLRNDYFEESLENLSVLNPSLDRLLNRPTSKVFSAVCLREAMDLSFNESSSSFKTCGRNGKLQAARRPCISKNYFQTIEHSLNLVSSCMVGYLNPTGNVSEQRKDLREILGMLTQESGLHLNAVSSTGSGGLGQLTQDAIQDVNDNMKDLKSYLKSNRNLSCADLSEKILKSEKPMQKNRSCDRFSIEKGNPFLNLIYTFAYQKNVRVALNSLMFRSERHAFRFASMPAAEREKLIRATSIWAHNTGSGGMMVPMNAILNQSGPRKIFKTAKEFLDLLAVSLEKHPHPRNSAPSRRKETRDYYQRIQNRIQTLEASSNGSCVQGLGEL